MALASTEAPLHVAFADVEAQLLPLVRQKLQEHGGGAAQQQEPDLGPMMASLRKLIHSHVSSTQELQVPGIPLPEVDEQLGPLQQEVEAVLQRLAGHRQQVPAVMAAALEQLMVQLRPQEQDTHDTTDQDGAAMASPDSGAPATDEQQLEAARQLHASLKAALNKLPALRARLQEATGRLDRNLTAVDAAQAQAALPPRTVERVLLRRGTNADAAAGDADC